MKKKETFVWGEEQEKAFKTIKETLKEEPILIYPMKEETFIVFTDASKRYWLYNRT